MLTGVHHAILDTQANWIRQFPEIRFKVFGHTDLVGSKVRGRGFGAYYCVHGLASFGGACGPV